MNAYHKQSLRSPYMAQLDSLRSFAVLAVLIHHFCPSDFFLNSYFNVGPQAVRFFFVLSGFLITGILLRCKSSIEFSDKNFWSIIKRFYIRRVLRLLPAYYLTIFLSWLAAHETFKQSVLWHLFHLSNFYYSFINEFDTISSHFWALSVEEQFYLFWPFLILLCPLKHLPKVLICGLPVAFIFRFSLILLGWDNSIREYILPLGSLDSFILGGLLAFCREYRSHLPPFMKQPIVGFVKTFLVLLCGTFIFLKNDIYTVFWAYDSGVITTPALTAISPLIQAILFTIIIHQGSKGIGGILGKILSFEPLIYLGRISYGVYLYHLLTAHLIGRLWAHFNWPYDDQVWYFSVIYFLVCSLSSIGAASLSWRYFEKPIVVLKRHFSY